MNLRQILALALLLGPVAAFASNQAVPKNARQPLIDQGFASGSNSVWNTPPIILGPTNGTEGDTLTFSNAMFSAWTGNGVVETNFCTFTNVLVNGTVTPTTQTITLGNGRSVGSLGVVVSPIAPTANFTGSPTSGPPPLAVIFTNLSTGAYTNALWNFGTFTSNTLAGSVSVTYPDIGTNTVSLTVAGYGTNALARADYILSFSNSLGSLVFDGTQNYATISNSQASADLITPPFTYEFWMKSSDATLKEIMWAGDGQWFFTINASPGTIRYESNGQDVYVPVGYLDGAWHHHALVVDAGNAGYAYVDGSLVASNMTFFGTTGLAADMQLSGTTGDGPFAGSIALWRISNVARYTTNFVAPVTFTTDANTLNLLLLKEGSGDTAADETGNHPANLFGTPIPTWGTFP